MDAIDAERTKQRRMTKAKKGREEKRSKRKGIKQGLREDKQETRKYPQTQSEDFMHAAWATDARDP